MTEKPQTTRKKPASSRERSVARRPAALQADPETIKQALEDLGITVPYYTARVVGNRIELTLYGGQVVTWSPAKACPEQSERKE